MKPSEQCKNAGLSSLKELEKITTVKERTLTNWHKHKPAGFKALLLGAVEIKKVDEMKLKAYNTYPGDNPYESGCLLVFAKSRSQAKTISLNTFFGMDHDYIDMRAIRVKRLDHLADIKNGEPWVSETNDDLPDGNKFYIETL